MDLGLSKRTALVCGASRGIGYAVAAELVREGAQVAICARDAKAVTAAAAKLAPMGTKVLQIVADLGTSEGTESAVAKVLGYGPGQTTAMVNDYQRTTRRAHGVVDRLFWGD